jgi:hypothetical protein
MPKAKVLRTPSGKLIINEATPMGTSPKKGGK